MFLLIYWWGKKWIFPVSYNITYKYGKSLLWKYFRFQRKRIIYFFLIFNFIKL